MTSTAQDTDELIILSESISPTIGGDTEAKSILETSDSEKLDLGGSLDSEISILGESEADKKEETSDILFPQASESESLVIDNNETSGESLIGPDTSNADVSLIEGIEVNNDSSSLFDFGSNSETSLETSEEKSSGDTLNFSLESKTEEKKSETMDFGGISIGGNLASASIGEVKEFNMNSILDDTIAKMEERRGQNDKEIENKNSEISLLKSRIEELRKQVSERENNIKKLQKENTNIEVNISQLKGMKSSESSASTRTRTHNSKKVAIK